MHIESDVHVDQTWGSVTVHRRWGCVDRRSNRSKVEGKLTVGLPKARWSDYREGSAVRWVRRDRSGMKSAFASQWWIGVWFVTKSAFGLALIGVWFADRCLVRYVIGVCIVLSLARSLFCSLSSFFLWLSLSFVRVRKMFKGKMIL